MLAKTVHLPTELVEKDAYQHQDTWGGFLESDHSSNHLSQSDMTLLRIAQHDIKKQHSKALKSEKTVMRQRACFRGVGLLKCK